MGFGDGCGVSPRAGLYQNSPGPAHNPCMFMAWRGSIGKAIRAALAEIINASIIRDATSGRQVCSGDHPLFKKVKYLKKEGYDNAFQSGILFAYIQH